MSAFLDILGVAIIAVLALVAKLFKNKADRLEAERLERDAHEMREVGRMIEELAGVQKQWRDVPPPDVKNRTDFE
jgi:hypothetical protein